MHLTKETEHMNFGVGATKDIRLGHDLVVPSEPAAVHRELEKEHPFLTTFAFPCQSWMESTNMETLGHLTSAETEG